MPKLLFTVTEDWAFCSHRLTTAKAALDAGFDVVVAARMGAHQQKIEGMGFRTVSWAVKRESLNPFTELAALFDLIRIYKQERPDAAYHVAIKAIMYGAIAARMAGVKKTISLFSGMGVVFISNAPKFRAIRALVTPVLRWALRPATARLQVQNTDDRQLLNGLGISTPEKTDLIAGSGLDLEDFPYTPEPDATPKAVLVARMLWDKGVGELIEAARVLKARGVALDIVLVGDPDPANPASITAQQLTDWQDEGLVEWLGRRTDIAAIWQSSHIAVLPSYREGMPRALLEAAATGRAMVAFDAPGCRDLVRDGENGVLVPFQDGAALADALERLATDPDLRQRMGRTARDDMEQTYSATAIRARLKTLFESLKPQ